MSPISNSIYPISEVVYINYLKLCELQNFNSSELLHNSSANNAIDTEEDSSSDDEEPPPLPPRLDSLSRIDKPLPTIPNSVSLNDFPYEDSDSPEEVISSFSTIKRQRAYNW